MSPSPIVLAAANGGGSIAIRRGTLKKTARLEKASLEFGLSVDR